MLYSAISLLKAARVFNKISQSIRVMYCTFHFQYPLCMSLQLDMASAGYNSCRNTYHKLILLLHYDVTKSNLGLGHITKYHQNAELSKTKVIK